MFGKSTDNKPFNFGGDKISTQSTGLFGAKSEEASQPAKATPTIKGGLFGEGSKQDEAAPARNSQLGSLKLAETTESSDVMVGNKTNVSLVSSV